ncbi:MAG: hypothetical protein D6715_06290 [Calditrichaeota bacterium]|nr:MAG: hypothetical protein D6715_06290 [Calditrichota bacterium]
MVGKSFRIGLKTGLGQRKLVLLYYLASLLAALPVTLAFSQAMGSFLGRSLIARDLGGHFNMDFFFEYLFFGKNGLATLPFLWLLAALVYLLGLLLLSGGLFAQFYQDRPYQAQRFWADAFHHWGRMVRLGLLSVPVLLLLLAIQFLEVGLQRLIFGKQPYEYIAYWGRVVQMVLAYAGIWIFSLIFDFARWDLVANQQNKTRYSLMAGIRFVFSQFSAAGSLYALFLLTSGLLTLVYILISGLLGANAVPAIFLLILIQQIYMWLRAGLRVGLLAGERELLRQLGSN